MDTSTNADERRADGGVRPRRRSLGLRRALAAGALIAVIGAACQPAPPPPPAVAKVTCPAGGSITVSTTIVAKVRDLLAAAKADKLSLCGGGYRTADAQIAVRKANCGPTYYDIWEKPANQCKPPTAIPGTSMHEKGLAIDFTSCSTQTTACFRWLKANAADFGLANLPSEPWHWSTNGR